MEKGEIKNPFEQLMLSFLFLVVPLAVSFWTITGMLDQYSELRWFFIYGVSALLLIGSFFSGFRVQFPDPRAHPGVLKAFLGALAFSILAAVLSFPASWELQLLEWLCFSVLLLWIFSVAQEEASLALLHRSIGFANGIAILGVGGYLIAQQTGHRWTYLAIHPGQQASLFGNKNYAASFFATAALIQLSGYRNRGPLLRRMASIAISLLALYGLASMKARGATLGFVAGALLLGWYHLRLAKRVKIFLVSALLAFSLLFAVFLSYRGVEEASDTRKIRLARWKNTIAMILEHPFGVGSTRYEFDYVPYSSRLEVDPEITEYNTSKSPHNLPLQIAVEHGVFTMLLLSAILAWILYRAGPLHPGAVAVLMGILVDGFFAFPFQVPYTFFVFPVYLGIALQGVLPAGTLPDRLSTKLRGGALAVIMMVGSLCVSSVMAESTDMNDERLMKRACVNAPWRLRNCVSYANILGNQRRFSEAIDVASDVLERQPNLFPMLFVLLEVHRLAGNQAEYCAVLGRFDGLFSWRSSLHEEWLSKCVPGGGGQKVESHAR